MTPATLPFVRGLYSSTFLPIEPREATVAPSRSEMPVVASTWALNHPLSFLALPFTLTWISLSLICKTSLQESKWKSVLIYSPVEGEICISAPSAGCLPVDINLLTLPCLDNRGWGVLIFKFTRHQVINLPVGQRDSWCFLFAPEETLGSV